MALRQYEGMSVVRRVTVSFAAWKDQPAGCRPIGIRTIAQNLYNRRQSSCGSTRISGRDNHLWKFFKDEYWPDLTQSEDTTVVDT